MRTPATTSLLSGLDPVHLARDVITYLWISVEYVRNSIAAPLPVDVAVVLRPGVGLVAAWLSLCALEVPGRLWRRSRWWPWSAGSWWSSRSRRWPSGCCTVAPPAWFAAFGWLATHRRGRLVVGAVVVGALALDAWFLLELASASTDPGLLDPALPAATSYSA